MLHTLVQGALLGFSCNLATVYKEKNNPQSKIKAILISSWEKAEKCMTKSLLCLEIVTK